MGDINVSNVASVYSAVNTAPAKADAGAAKSAETAAAPEAGVVYEKSSGEEKKATYSINKMSAEDRAALVQQLKQDQIDRQNQLAQLVQKMFTGQAGVARASRKQPEHGAMNFPRSARIHLLLPTRCLMNTTHQRVFSKCSLRRRSDERT